jgi:hypothetical protein
MKQRDNTTNGLRLIRKKPKEQFFPDNKRNKIIIFYRCMVMRGSTCIADFEGPHSEQQANAVFQMALAGATEATLANCVLDIGMAAVQKRSLEDQPILIEV